MTLTLTLTLRTWCHIARPGARFAHRFAAALVLLALTAACGGGGGDDDEGGGTTSTTAGATTTTTSTTAATGAGSSTSSIAPGGAGPSTTTAPRSTSSTTTSTSPGSAGGVDGSGTAAGPLAPPGRYVYETTGVFTSPLGRSPRNGETVLTVEPAGAAQQRSVRAGPGRTVEQVLRAQADGVYLVSLSITDSGFGQEVRPAQPVLAIPSSVPVGRQWSWQATTVDGRTTVSSAFRVARTETVTVGGEPVPASVVEATITTTGDVVSTGRQTFWYSERHRLIVQMQEVTDGRVAGIATFRSETSDRLRSLRPA